MKILLKLAFTAIAVVMLAGCSDKEDIDPDVNPPQEQEDDDDDENPTVPPEVTLEEFLAKYNNVEKYLLLNSHIYNVISLEDTNIAQIYSSNLNQGAKDPVTNTYWTYGFSSELAKEENNVVIYIHFDKRNMNQWKMNGSGKEYTYINMEYSASYDQFIMGTDIWAYEMWWGSGSRVLVVKYGEAIAKADFSMETSIREGNWLLENDYFN